MSHRARFRPVVRGGLRRAAAAYETLSEADRRARPTRDADFTTDFDRSLTDEFQQFFDERPETYTVCSEERERSPTAASDYLVILDEVDGTANLAKGVGELPFGPVVAVCDDPDPTFEDVAAMGYLVLPTGDLYEAYRGEGAFLTRQWADGGGDGDSGDGDGEDDADGGVRLETTGRETAARTDETTGTETPPAVLVDQYMLAGRPELAGTLWQLGYPGDYRSLGHHCALVARGAYDVGVSGDYCVLHEGKRATAEELAGGYRLVAEAGGVVADWEGVSLRDERIGFAEGEPHDVLVAATAELAADVADRLAATDPSADR